MTPIAQTKAYFKLSNERRLDDISKLFHKKATYSSDNLGVFFGVGDIMQMMNGFFANSPEIHWQITHIQEVKNCIVEVQFEASGKDKHGKAFHRKGTERLVIENGLIRHIEVRN